MEILSIFHTGIEYVSLLPTHYENPLQTVDKKNSNVPSPWAMWTPSNKSMPAPTPLTTPNGSSIASRTFTRLRHKVSIGYNGTLHVHPKFVPFRRAISTPVYLPHPWTQPTHHTKRHPDPISRFSTIHRTVRQTDTPTDRQTDRWHRRITCTNTRSRCIDYSDADNNILSL